MVGWSGLKRVEYWLRPDAGKHGQLADDDPAWQTARWQPCAHRAAADRLGRQPARRRDAASDVWGFDPQTGRPQGMADALQRGAAGR